MLPGRSSMNAVIRLMSAAYKIWVRCLRTCVHSSGVGASRYTQPFPSLDTTLLPKGVPIQLCVTSCFSQADAPVSIGSVLPFSNIPLGTSIHKNELFAVGGGQMGGAAGFSTQLIAK